MGAVRLRNLGEAVHLYAPPDSPNSLPVDSGQVITVAGPVEENEAGDAYLCGEGDAQRAFPKSRWAVEATPAAKKTPAKAADDEKGDG
ncbi:hypothetical protein EDD90_7393 [Streptomyces sp. Ag109_O5-1]|uniref:hypothetical protein n=1 Tax=Streptomyces sp. Ag109_O5-1 TaxID=1938851 RepID=UPI000F507F2C|nr:hypothetical protein [Streptomyces sp. Ag109_O5-1]RPE44163.1 hypothetical protein EDD90_7393 [Streptomyces sp. Ag109_O5-1]